MTLLAGAALLLAACGDDTGGGNPEPEAPDVPEKPAIPADAVDLSAKGTANCYIVAPATTALFDAACKGNSSTESIGEAAGAQLVWQSDANLIAQTSYFPDERKIVVETGDKSGNAVVAAVDAAGNILWSWHLWVVDYDPAASLFTTTPNASGTTWSFMDRNLGALTVERGSFDSNGMLYQWGRKDPFPGTTTFTVMREDYTYEVDGEPTVYDGDDRELPKFSSMTEFHGTIEKSIYDPCPVGYKVPVCDADGNTPYAWLQYASMKWDDANRGCEQEGQ